MQATADTVRQKDREPLRRSPRGKKLSQTVHKDAAHQNIEKVDEDCTEILGKEEGQVHDQQKDRQPHPTVQDDAVDTVGQGTRDIAFADDHFFGDLGD